MKRRIRDTMSASAGGRSVARELALSLTAAVGLLIFGTAAALLVFGMKPLVFLSGSMEPQIGTGALALTVTTPASELSEGDVISFLRSDGARVTHRIASITAEGQSFRVITRGDANESDDPEPSYLAEADRVFWHLEGAGMLLTEATKFQYTFPFGVLVGMAALYGFRRASPAPDAVGLPARPAEEQQAVRPDETGADGPTRFHRPAKVFRLAAVAVLGCVTVVAGGPVAPVGTLGAFSDGGSDSGSFSALGNFLAPRVVDGQTITCSATTGPLGSLNVTFTWQAPAGTVTRYETELVREGAPLLYRETQSPSTTNVTYVLPGSAGFTERYRFAVTATNEHGTNGTTYKTLVRSGSTVTCG